MRKVADGGLVLRDDASGLLQSVGELSDIIVERYDVCAKPSASIGLADVAALADEIELAAADGLGGAVVTHGTDTIEETAFSLALMLRKELPVVITGAMRSADSIAPDGPANLAGAIRIATHPDARGRGVLVFFGDEIHAAHLVRKIHSSRLHAFSSDPLGPLGHLAEENITFELSPTLQLPRLNLVGPVPIVPILYAAMDLEPETIRAFDVPGIGAVIITGVGGGHVSSRAALELERLAAKIPVVITSRVGMGPALRKSYAYVGGDIDLQARGLIYGGRWRPTHARIIVQLALSAGLDPAAALST